MTELWTVMNSLKTYGDPNLQDCQNTSGVCACVGVDREYATHELCTRLVWVLRASGDVNACDSVIVHCRARYASRSMWTSRRVVNGA